jgi:hypothetical protein
MLVPPAKIGWAGEGKTVESWLEIFPGPMYTVCEQLVDESEFPYFHIIFF